MKTVNVMRDNFDYNFEYKLKWAKILYFFIFSMIS